MKRLLLRSLSGSWPKFLLLLLGFALFPFSGHAQSSSPAAIVAAPLSAPPSGVPVTPVAPGPDPSSGTLLFRAVRPGEFVEAPRLGTDVALEVSGPMARAKVTQRFENPSAGWVEGVYVFPLPEQAAVDTLRIRVGDRFLEGEVKERGEAKRVYEKAKTEGAKAGLLEQDRPNVFRASVANVGPHETVIVQIEYQQTVRFDSGHFALRFPLVVAPRYHPYGSAGSAAAVANAANPGSVIPVLDPVRLVPPGGRPGKGATLTNPVNVRVNVHAGFPLGDVASSYHSIRLTRPSDREASVELTSPVAADRDFELTWSPVTSEAPQGGLLRERIGSDDYLLAFVIPPSGSAPPRPREAVFVIDNSGSMGGESMRQAKAALDLALSRLRPNDTFNVLRFDDSLTVFFPSSVPATAEHVARARSFVSGLQASGGTEMLPALRAALRDRLASPTEGSERLRQVLFLTDGAVSNEDDMFAEIGKNLGRSRLFPVGIGSAPNSFFMTRAARLGRGTFTHVGSTDEVAQRTGELLAKIERPLITDVNAVLMGAELWPNPIPDVYAGEPVMLTTKAPSYGSHGSNGSGSGTLSLRGKLPSGNLWTVDLDVAQALPGTGIGKLWARSKIEAAEEQRFLGASPEKVDQTVLDVALAFHLVSRRTSLVAVDVTPVRPMNAPLQTQNVPLLLPAGWDFEKVFGPVPSVGKRDALVPADLAISLAAPSAKEAAPPHDDASVNLPGTATTMTLLLLSGAASCLLGLTLLALLGGTTRRVRSFPRARS